MSKGHFASWLEQEEKGVSARDGRPKIPPKLQTDYRRAGTREWELLRVQQRPGQFSHEAADEFTLQLVVQGVGTTRIGHGDRSFPAPLMRGGLALSPPRERLSYQPEGSSELILAVLPESLVRTLAEPMVSRPWVDFGGLHHQVFRDELIEQYVRGLWVGADQGTPAGRLFADGTLLAIVARLTDKIAPPQGQPPTGGLAGWQERRTVDYLRAHLAEDVNLATLAAIANLSQFHFARAFKRTLGVPPHRFHSLLRLEKAMELLVETELSVIEVALKVGYDSPQALSRLFQRELGTSPSAFRRERRR